MKTILQVVTPLAFAFVAESVQASVASNLPRFETAPVLASWVTLSEDPQGRKMKLAKDFAYFDAKGVKWLAPAGSVVDGASIPKVAWSILGGPYEGLYRDASVIHDVACVERTRTWQAVHRVFYEAMITSGVDEKKAKVMYAAVYYFGPRWDKNGKNLPIWFRAMPAAKGLNKAIQNSNISYLKENNEKDIFERFFLDVIAETITSENLSISDIEWIGNSPDVLKGTSNYR